MFLEISQNPQENTRGKVSFLIKFQTEATASDLSRVFSLEDFLMKWKKGNTLMELKYYIFTRVSICLTSKISKEIWQTVIWSENVFKENLNFHGYRGILLRKSFWVVNTWRAPVRKRLKGSTLNFAHTFLTDCCTKPCPHFS